MEHIEYKRKRSNLGVVKTVGFDYVTFSNQELKKKIEKRIVWQNNVRMETMGIDKLTFSFHRDFLNEYPDLMMKQKCGFEIKFLRGAVTVNIYKRKFDIHLHREYIPLHTVLSSYIENVFRYLILCTNLFKLPLHKTITDIETENVKEIDYPQFKNVTTEEEYFQAIYSQRKLTCIELYFDFHGVDMKPYLPRKFRNFVGDISVYTDDYRKYKNGIERRSMMVFYDKEEEQWDRKHRVLMRSCKRFEIRLYPYSYSCMKGTKGLELMDHTYDGLLNVLSKPIKSHIKKRRMNFRNFIEHLPKGYERLIDLLYMYPKKDKSC